MEQCNKCKALGLTFNRNYKPDEFLEGKTNSKIWVIGLNPAEETSWTDKGRNIDSLKVSFDNPDNLHPYFKDFKKVSEKLFELFGTDEGVAHTDLVKCSSKSWPPENCTGKKAKSIIENCSPYLIKQIEIHKPKLIICNGAPVSHMIKEVLKESEAISDTAYKTKDGTIVVLSGFIGRIDNFSKRRLGYEIEGLMEKFRLFKKENI